jgi:hypothetical protein
MQRYLVHVCLNDISIFMEDRKQQKMMQDPAVHPARTLPRTLSESKISYNKIVKYPPD